MPTRVYYNLYLTKCQSLLVKIVIIRVSYFCLQGENMDFGEKIRAAREDLDLSQADVAGQIPMNQSNYSKIERGVQEPSMDQLRSICRILHLDPSYLLSLNRYEPVSTEDLALLRDVKALLKKYGAGN